MVPHDPEGPSPAALASADERLRALFEHLPALAAYWDRDLHNVLANPAYREWLGLTPEQIHGRHMSEVLGPVAFEQVLPFVRGALAGQEQTMLRTIDDGAGHTREAQTSYVPDVVDGRVRGLFMLATDITQRMVRQRQLEDAQQLADLGSWSLDTTTREISWSPQMFDIVGHDPEQFEPSWDSLMPRIHPDDRERVVATSTAAMDAGVDYEMDYRIVRPDGQVREVHSKVRAVRDESGRMLRLVGTMQDVTVREALLRDLARTNDELQAMNRLNEDVLALVGHDVRQPLGVILGHLEELTTSWDETSDASKRERVRTTYLAAQRMTSLIENILAMAGGGETALPTQPVPLRVADLVEEVLGELPENHRAEKVLGPGPGVALADPFHLRQILTNLISNAFRYGRPPVVVEVTTAEAEVTVTVSDCGAGVPEEFVPFLFDRLTRAGSGRAGATAGAGFGLYIVRRLAEAGGGHVEFRPGRPTGACFVLHLPVPSR